jgi:hypothetical protein
MSLTVMSNNSARHYRRCANIILKFSGFQCTVYITVRLHILQVHKRIADKIDIG